MTVTPRFDFGDPGFLRLNFGYRRELLGEALRRMEKALVHR
jgi:bifunctional pyridoxal-dependent enzyme with beta-cystathionase and maltose regulon repressor activities